MDEQVQRTLDAMNSSAEAQSTRIDLLAKNVETIQKSLLAQQKELEATMTLAREWINDVDERIDKIATITSALITAEAHLTAATDRFSQFLMRLESDIQQMRQATPQTPLL